MGTSTRPAERAGTLTLGDLTVNRLGFGAMRVTGPYAWGGRRDRAAMYELLRRAYELGHNVFDTADSYASEYSPRSGPCAPRPSARG
jgi:pyridoxine 4-dehydrogenase